MVVNRSGRRRLTRKEKVMAFFESWKSWLLVIPVGFAFLVAMIYISGGRADTNLKKVETQVHETLTDGRHAMEAKMAESNAEQAARQKAIYAQEAKRCRRN